LTSWSCGPRLAAACPTATTQHPSPVTFYDPIDFSEAPEIPGNTVIAIVASQDGVDFVGLVTDFIMPYSPHQLLQRDKAALEPRFLGSHPNLKVTLLVSRAVECQPQEVDGFRAR
jgi:hypothetical protein